MIKILLLTLLVSWLPAVQASTDKTPPPAPIIQVDTHDGSRIYARPHHNNVAITPWISRTSWAIPWSAIQEIKQSKDKHSMTTSLTNGDLLSGQWTHPILKVDTSFGSLRIPTNKITRIRITKRKKCTNIALGKPVSGQDGASHGRGLAKHLTDGDYQTHAKPPASNFDYTIDLGKDANDGYSVQHIKIYWGRFGDQFNGIRAPNGKGWASAAWPGEYVTSYQIHYRTSGSDDWILCHSASCRPVDEDKKNICVERIPTDIPGCSSESITTINGLDLTGVTGVRIRANGGHWIGLHELEIWGTP